jgi:hypothetical protein
VWQQRYYLSIECNIPFFNEPFIKLNVNQETLLRYLEFYKKIYEIDEDKRPKEQIINNIYLCDEWLRVYVNDIRKKQKNMEAPSKAGTRNTRETFTF